ncbi:MAG: class I SAM-dependent methyltransferase [Polyangiaceae bacterium]|nr:class I SAM-dependent methyltransferase [Polyangiaceae bacterium]
MIDLGRIAPHLTCQGDGLYVAPTVGTVSYPAGANAGCRAVEDESYWFSHRNQVIRGAMKRFPPPGWVLDVGGGNGVVAQALTRVGYEVALLEPGPHGVAAARARGIRPVIQATLDDAALRPGSVPAIGLFDVLEHVENDGAFLVRLREALAPRGRLFVTVPAFAWLWSSADAHAGHFRRYSPRSLERTLATSGLSVEHTSCFFAFLTLPVLAGRTLRDRLQPPRVPNGDDDAEHLPSRWLRPPIAAMAAAERTWLARGHRCLVGSSVIAVARRT